MSTREKIKWLKTPGVSLEWVSDTGMPNGDDEFVPDFRVFREGVGEWYVKWRTSARYSGPFSSVAKAKASCESPDRMPGTSSCAG
jgi:hypothetical protein